MLHILWILIKFILILLGILLGLVLLAVLLVLFCPVRYSAAAAKEGDSFKEAEIEARVSWLFRAIGVRFFFKNGEQKLVITLFGISLDQIRGWLDGLGKRRKARRRRGSQSRGQGSRGKTGAKSGKPVADSGKAAADDQKKSSKQKERTRSEPEKSSEKKAEVKEIQAKESELPHEKTTEPEAERTEEGSEAESRKKEEQQEPIRQEPSREMPEKKSPEAANTEDVADEMPEVIEGETSESVNTESGKSQLPVLFTRIRDILTRIIGLPGALWRKITSFIKGILGKIRHIRNTIAGIRSKLDWWKEFLGNEKTKAAIALVWKDAKGLIHHVLPTKVEGQVTFGCDDPSITGTVLAVLGMTFPFHQNRIQVTPLFDGENQLTGNISLKGRIYGIMFVKAALEIYINKNVKYVINRWKHKED